MAKRGRDIACQSVVASPTSGYIGWRSHRRTHERARDEESSLEVLYAPYYEESRKYKLRRLGRQKSEQTGWKVETKGG